MQWQKQGISKLIIQNSLLSGAIMTVLSCLAQPVKAEELFGNDGIYFGIDTKIEFQFVESNGAFLSEFGVVNLDKCQDAQNINTCERTPLFQEVKASNEFQDPDTPTDFEYRPEKTKYDFQGTCGDAVLECTNEFLFTKNTRYAFYLASSYNNQPRTTLYSTNVLNQDGKMYLEIDGDLTGLAAGGVNLNWDDTGIEPQLGERDFNDFIVTVGGHLVCPFNDVATDTNSNSN